jgi:hypothetical protein
MRGGGGTEGVLAKEFLPFFLSILYSLTQIFSREPISFGFLAFHIPGLIFGKSYEVFILPGLSLRFVIPTLWRNLVTPSSG